MTWPSSRSADNQDPTAKSRRWLLCLALLTFAATAAFAAQIYTVSQRGRLFSVDRITLHRGDAIRFTNDDEFLHQIYVDSKTMSFDSDEQRPGQAIVVTFPETGTFPVRCHIHPKMLLAVTVE